MTDLAPVIDLAARRDWHGTVPEKRAEVAAFSRARFLVKIGCHAVYAFTVLLPTGEWVDYKTRSAGEALVKAWEDLDFGDASGGSCPMISTVNQHGREIRHHPLEVWEEPGSRPEWSVGVRLEIQ